jgi:hypothetical protein
VFVARRPFEKEPTVRQCQVPGCTRDADYEVFVVDFHRRSVAPDEADRLDLSCPYICEEHARENEAFAHGDRRPVGEITYPYTNRGGATGLTLYRPMEDGRLPAPFPRRAVSAGARPAYFSSGASCS